MPPLREALAAELADLRVRGLYRRTRRLGSAPAPTALLDGREVLVLGSNNYLGLTEHPAVRAAAAEAVTRWGTGTGGSRLTTGSLALIEELERDLAAFLHTEATIIFGTGYQAALGAIPALVGPGDLILSDALNHASLVDGCRLSRADVRVYRHGDAHHARTLLVDRGRFGRCLLLTDGVFSMDGDLAPLPALASLCEEHDAWLMVDDAHGVGILGATGGGTVEHLGVAERTAIRLGTLSKALASEGGFIAGSGELIEYLRNRARSFMFSTAPAPAAVAAAAAALRVIRAEPGIRPHLASNARRMRTGLQRLGFDAPPGETPIIPVILGEPDAALAVSGALEAAGVWVPAIRPPSVPAGGSRLRVSVMATHSPAQIDQALDAFARVSARAAPEAA